MNIFSSIITEEHKNLFNQAIDSVISSSGLGTSCKLIYLDRLDSTDVCTNCSIDPIYKKSTNKYNGTGPSPFPDNSTCPVCNGDGYLRNDNSEIITMAVLTSEKSWIDTGLDNAKLPNGAIQTICQAIYASKINNAIGIIISDDKKLNNTLEYEKIADLSYIGFGSHRYVIAMWKKS
jgi:hypothetical protein